MHEAGREQARERLRESMCAVIQANGLIHFPFKEKVREYMRTVCIFKHARIGRPDRFVFTGSCPTEESFRTLEDAIHAAIRFVFVRSNIALAYDGIRYWSMTDRDLDDMSEAETEALVKLYNEKYFDFDHPYHEDTAGLPTGSAVG